MPSPVVSVRFKPEVLAQVGVIAKRRGSSRSAWITQTVERGVADERVRDSIVRRLESEIRPLLSKDKLHEGGYDCCGCSTYDEILNHAIRIVLDEES